MKTHFRIVIIGAGGRLGSALVRQYSAEHEVTGFNHAQLDLNDFDRSRATLREPDFDLLINAAGQTDVDRCEREPAEAFRLNAEAPGVLAEICAAKNAHMIHLSTDYVFDGAKTEPYREGDKAKPISVYGESKLQGEERVLSVSPDHLVARVSWIFGPDRPSFIDWVIQQAREKDHVDAIADKFSTPTYTLDLAGMLERLWNPRVFAPTDQHERPGGILHLANGGGCSWQEYGQWALDCCKATGISLRADVVRPIFLREMKQFVARRPIYTVLSTEKYRALTGERPRHWRDAVEAYVRRNIAGS